MFHSHTGKPSSNLIKATRPRTIANDVKPKVTDDVRKERKTKYKIPKNVRYDLENALVSLCDVWFEEIKPYLVRNNIKVHVHDSEMNMGSGTQHCSVMNDRRPKENPGASSCLHLDPGAASDRRRRATVSCADCYSTRQPASKVQSRKPRAPRPPPPSLRVPPLHLSQSPRNGNTVKTSSASKEKKKKRARISSPPRQHRVARLCRMPNVMQPTPNR